MSAYFLRVMIYDVFCILHGLLVGDLDQIAYIFLSIYLYIKKIIELFFGYSSYKASE